MKEHITSAQYPGTRSGILCNELCRMKKKKKKKKKMEI